MVCNNGDCKGVGGVKKPCTSATQVVIVQVKEIVDTPW